VRIFIFEESHSRLVQLVTTEPSASVLSIGYYCQGNRFVLFTGATDGYVRWYDVTEVLSRRSDVRCSALAVTGAVACHQSGVNCLHVSAPPSEQRCVIATGGDDQSICIHWFPLLLGAPERTVRFENAHIAAIMGIHLFDEKVFTVSNDQTLNIWRVSAEGLHSVSSHALHIADVSGLCVQHRSAAEALRILIAGFGLQLIDI